MNCERTRDLLDAFHDDELTPDLRGPVASHLEACDDCAEALGDLAAVDTALGAVGVPPMPTDLGGALAGRLAAAAGPPPTMALPLWGRALRVVALSAGLGAVFLVGLERWIELHPPPGEAAARLSELDEVTLKGNQLAQQTLLASRHADAGRRTEALHELAVARRMLEDLKSAHPGWKSTGMDYEYVIARMEREAAEVPDLETATARRGAEAEFLAARSGPPDRALVEAAKKYARVLLNQGRPADADRVLREALEVLRQHLPEGTWRASDEHYPRWLSAAVASPLEPLVQLADAADKLDRDAVWREALELMVARSEAAVATQPLANRDRAWAHQYLWELDRKLGRWKEAKDHAEQSSRAILGLLEAVRGESEDVLGAVRFHVPSVVEDLFTSVYQGQPGRADRELALAAAKKATEQLLRPPYGILPMNQSPRQPAIQVLDFLAQREGASLDPADRPTSGAMVLMERLREKLEAWAPGDRHAAFELASLQNEMVSALCPQLDCSALPPAGKARARAEIARARVAADEAEARIPDVAALRKIEGIYPITPERNRLHDLDRFREWWDQTEPTAAP